MTVQTRPTLPAAGWATHSEQTDESALTADAWSMKTTMLSGLQVFSSRHVLGQLDPMFAVVVVSSNGFPLLGPLVSRDALTAQQLHYDVVKFVVTGQLLNEVFISTFKPKGVA